MQWEKLFNPERRPTMKRLICTLLSVVFILTLTACSGNEINTDSSDTANSSSDASNTVENETETTSDKKVLVVYYSASGNTKEVAETMADTLKADIFEILPNEPYTDEDLDWTNDNSRVSVEHNDESKRDVPLIKITPDNWEQYDTVYIGFPVWWGIAAWPINGFVKGNDFTGKNVIPFCTSSSSGIGESGEILADIAGTGNWLEGKRFSSNTSEEDVKEWINEIAID